MIFISFLPTKTLTDIHIGFELSSLLLVISLWKIQTKHFKPHKSNSRQDIIYAFVKPLNMACLEKYP